MATRVENQLKQLPAKPGVYLFRDEEGDVLYVGKAKSLRPRVRSYFQKTTDGRAQIRALPGRVADIEVIVTGSEVEALHLEQNLVKRHRPPFNVRLRDDKSFPYIAVTVEDEYPRVMFTRERHRPGVWYFGPYANAKKVRETLDVLNRVFRYRPCEGPKPGRHSGIPCLDFHIDRCLAPCVGYVSPEDYRGIIDSVIEFLSGDVKPIQRELERQMHAAATDERFEDAARYRNRLFAVQHLVERQAVERQSVGTADVIGFAAEGDRAVVQIFPLRGGKMVDRHSFHLENVGGQDVTTILESFGLEYYGSAPSVPPQIVVPRDAGDLSALAELLGGRRGARVEIRTAERGEKRRLQQLADENALHVLKGDVAQSEARRARRVEALEQLRETLNLEALPLRIECFDISTAMGQDNVGSMVVFQDGLPKKAHYRKFTIRGQEGMDDFAAMGEMVSRRFARLAAGRTADEYDESFAATPNLVVVDGGKGQLAAATRGDASVRSPARRGDRAREARRGGLRAGSRAPGRPLAPRPGTAAPAADPRRGAPLRRRLPPAAPRDARLLIVVRRARGSRAGAPARAAQPLRLGRRDARGGAGRARRRPRRSRQGRAQRLRPAAQSRARLATPNRGTGSDSRAAARTSP